MIEPFVAEQVRMVGQKKVISYGTSSYGYDVRCANHFKVFTNIYSATVDPKAFDERSFVDIEDDVCIVPPNSFVLASTIEYFRIPADVLTLCVGKSTYARCGMTSAHGTPALAKHLPYAGSPLVRQRRTPCRNRQGVLC